MTSKRPFYYEYAWAYDLLVDANTEKRVNFIKEIIASNHLPSPVNILDAGCGSGRLYVKKISQKVITQQPPLQKLPLTDEANQMLTAFEAKTL